MESQTPGHCAEIGSDVDIGNAEICLVTANSSKSFKIKTDIVCIT